MSDFVIRTAKETELPAVQDLNYELFLHDQEHFGDLHVQWPYEPDGEAYFRRVIAGENAVCFVAEEDGKLIGYLAGILHTPNAAYKGKRAEIDNMCVTKSARHRGVGKQLVNAFYGWCKENGVTYAVVTAFSPNDKAMAFYEAQGFEPYAHTFRINLERNES